MITSMNEKDIFNAITNIPDEIINESCEIKKRNNNVMKWAALAASAVFIIGAAVAIRVYYKNPFEGIYSNTKDTTADIRTNISESQFSVIETEEGTEKALSGKNSQIQPTKNPASDNKLKTIMSISLPKAFSFSDIISKNLYDEKNPVDDNFFSALDNFSYKTASKILKTSGNNSNYSPISLYYALSLAASGANGKTADELFSLLGISDKSVLSKQCGNLYRQLYMDNEIGKLKIGNSLWINKSFEVKDSFIKNACENFYTESFYVDFADSKTGKAIGKWISDNTKGNIIPSIETDSQQILSILNTVYFYDEWLEKFKTEDTKSDTFYVSESETVQCKFMNRPYIRGEFSKGNGFKRSGIELLNGGEMVFILPDKGVSPSELISTPEKMKEAFEGGKSYEGRVLWQIPKFSYNSKYDIIKELEALGITSAFKANADFSGITKVSAFISDIRQETHIGIDEQGVEASAYTSIMISNGGPMPDIKTEMILDRPFLYGITAANGTLLFVGICENPAQ